MYNVKDNAKILLDSQNYDIRSEMYNRLASILKESIQPEGTIYHAMIAKNSSYNGVIGGDGGEGFSFFLGDDLVTSLLSSLVSSHCETVHMLVQDNEGILEVIYVTPDGYSTCRIKCLTKVDTDEYVKRVKEDDEAQFDGLISLFKTKPNIRTK